MNPRTRVLATTQADLARLNSVHTHVYYCTFGLVQVTCPLWHWHLLMGTAVSMVRLLAPREQGLPRQQTRDRVMAVLMNYYPQGEDQ